MKQTKTTFNKKLFAILLEKAKGDRTQRQFALDCGISYVQMRKLFMCGQENAPGLKLIKKISENSLGGVEMEDYLFCTGQIVGEKDKKAQKKTKALDIQSLYEKLSHSQQKTVYDFVDYLLNYKK